MRHHSFPVAMAACFLFGAFASAQEIGFTTTWSKADDLAGFESPNGKLVHVAQGGNPGGFLMTVKTTAILPKPYLRNNLGKLFGTGPGTLSFDLKALGDGSISSVGLFLSTGGYAFRYTLASKKLLGHDQSRADGWVRYVIPWKADWTEEQAIRSGWQPFSGKMDRWSAVIASPIWSQLDVSLSAGKGDQAVGIDNFRVEAGKVLDAKSRKRIDPDPPQQKPVAHFAFDEGAGHVLHDRSGNNVHGKINGAKWVANGGRWALDFDGVNDFVDCGDVSVVGAQTLAAWIYAEPIYSVWLGVPILGDGSCQLVQHVHDIRTGGSGLLPFRRWVHVAQAWDGRTGRLYVDGTLVSIWTSREPVANANFLLAGLRSRAKEEPADYERRFKGKIASVMLYNRALTGDEVLEDLRTSNITNSVMPMPIPQPGLGRIKVEVDAARLGKPLDKVSVIVEVLKAGADGNALASATLSKFNHVGRAVVDISAAALGRGSYVVRTRAMDTVGKPLGVPGEASLAWAGSVRFPSGPDGARTLNNLVTELLRVPGPDQSGAARKFVNPRTGFIYVSNRGSKEASLVAEGTNDATTLTLSRDYGDAYETMRYLPKGSYTISTPVARGLIVRAVAQTVHDYAHTQGMPVAPFGPYAGKFEERHVFPHMNTFLVQDFDIDKPFAKELKAKGRRLLAHTSTGIKPTEGQSPVDAASDKLGKGLGFSHPRYDGYLVDEFAESTDGHRAWSGALERLLSQPQFKGRALHAWTYALYDLMTYKGGEPGREFVRTLQKFDSPVQWECYLNSQRTELHAWHHIHDKLVGETLAAEQAFPGMVKSLIVVPYAYVTAGPPWLTMTQPSYDTRTYLEMQIRTVATDPVFAGVRGLGAYRSTYADEETVRWTARLYRHYAIEGRTEPLGKDPFLLTHIGDGDFEEQGRRLPGSSWQVKPAEEASIEFALHHSLGSTQGRYTGRQGDTVLITRRCGKAPNVFTQEIKNLEPGRLYSFRMFSADRQDLSKPDKHAVHIDFDNADLVPEKCFTHVGAGTRPKSFLNWHVRVFRAKSQTATLRIADWSDAKQPGGPVGQELMYNFIKVQPYWEE